MEDSKTKQYRQLVANLKQEVKSNSWTSSWLDLTQYILPRNGRYLQADSDVNNNDGRSKTQKIINSAATKAVKNLAAGMQGGLTSPARPWFVLTLPDEDLMEVEAVRQWLHDVRGLMLNVFTKSNFYNAVQNLYKEIGTYGTAALLIEEDDETIIRVRPFTIGEFYIDLNDKYRTDTFVRQFAMTARQMIKAYGEENVSEAVKTAYKQESQKRFEVVNCIKPNEDYDPQYEDVRGMEYISITYEVNGSHDAVLREAGYRTKPFVAPRWEVSGTDVYGGSPGFDTLSDIKMLQVMEQDKLKAIRKHVDPPMNAPTSMKGKGGTITGGGINYVDSAQGGQSFTPAYQTRGDINSISYEIVSVMDRIKEGFFNDLFLSLLDNNKNMTATEVAERQAEKMLMLSPVLTRLQDEFLDPVIERVFNIMLERGELPQAPDELANMEIKIEYISLLAQAQKMIGTKAVNELAGFVGNMMALDPTAVDKFDIDEAIDQVADMVGTPPKLVRTDDEVAKIREQRAQEQAAAAQAEQQAMQIQNAKALSETALDNNSALDAVSGVTGGNL